MQPLHVSVAVILDPQGRVLLSRRAEHLHQGGLWEFPGGKLEPGESVEQALRREIGEELGLRLLEHRPLIKHLHRYADKAVLLDVHLVTRFFGEPQGLEGQPLEWVEPGSLLDYPMPAADLPIIQAVTLPSRYLITGHDPLRIEPFMRRLDEALDAGIRMVQLRAGWIPGQALEVLSGAVLELCHSRGARLLLNASVEMVQRIGADGIHLSSKQLMGMQERPLGSDRLVAASCHNRDELSQAARLDLDFVVLSPVLTTTSHPQATPLGWGKFAELVELASLPVFALGGMQESLLHEAWEHGAQGIAGISCFWRG